MALLTMTRGDSATFTLTLVDGGGDPLDLSAASMTFTAKHSIRDSDEDAVIVKTDLDGITVATPASGVAVLAFVPTDTSDLEPGAILFWDIQLEQAGDVRTPLSGHLHVIGDVTRTVTGS